MDNLALPTVTIPAAAHAAGFTVRALRTLLATPHPFPLLGQPDRAAGAWNRVAPVDVVRLAVVRRLLDYGMCVADAADVIDRSVDRHVFGLATCGIDLPVSFLLLKIAGLRVFIAGAAESGLFVGDGAHAVPHETFLTVDVGAIGAAAIQRLTLGTSS